MPHSLITLVEACILFGHKDRYLLDAYVVMPDHVHLLFLPLPGWTLARIMQGMKGFTAREINKLLLCTGAFWQNENFDHLIRQEEDWQDKFECIHQNPVKAGLVARPQDYPYSSLVTLHSQGRFPSLEELLRQ